MRFSQFKAQNYEPPLLFSLMRRIILHPLLPKYVRALRAAAWNALFIISGLLLIALVGEVYLRLANPFLETGIQFHFVDGVGLIRKPDSEARYANWHDDIFVASRVNSQGFIDREPVSAERAAEGCHIAFMGDSFVEAREVAIADKFHVRLEEMAARDLPHLDVTTQAYGIPATGQINQLPFYDEYARQLTPKLVALVFFINDFFESAPALTAVAYGIDPDKMPYMTAQRGAGGDIALRPPDPEYSRLRLPNSPKRPWYEGAWEGLVGVSYFAKWLDTKDLTRLGGAATLLKSNAGAPAGPDPGRAARAAMIAERPCCAAILAGMPGWRPVRDVSEQLLRLFQEDRLLPGLEETLAYTAFGIEQFKRRADRDGASLVIFAVTDAMGMQGDPQFERLSAIAEPLGIPVISQYDYVVRQGHDYYQDYRWRTIVKWNATGHQRTAEFILEWLKANQEVCE